MFPLMGLQISDLNSSAESKKTIEDPQLDSWRIKKEKWRLRLREGITPRQRVKRSTMAALAGWSWRAWQPLSLLNYERQFFSFWGEVFAQELPVILSVFIGNMDRGGIWSPRARRRIG